MVMLSTEGVVSLEGPRATVAANEAAERLRALLRHLLDVSQGSPITLREALVVPTEGQHPLDKLFVTVTKALIPINRGAAKRALARLARETLRAKERAFPDRYPLDPLGPANLRQRTDLLIKRFTDFGGIEAYHDGFSLARDRLAGLRCPATILAAQDDPVIPVDDLLEIEKPECLDIEIQRWGGHCGFIENPGRRSWVERRVAEILEKPIK